ncbi:MAG: histidinol-phosphate aminotransferase family protein [Proteobacteria bacterium]|nr:histidinol-phosphate aminotransferase family protein [Pseudomonadota bacterium]
MFLKKKSYLRDIKRIRIPETRDLSNGLRLDRNEKADNWPENFIEAVLASKPASFFSTYPDLSGLYKKLATHLNVEEEQILVSSGIDGVIKTLFEILVEPGEKIGVFAPTYAMYDVYAKLFQAKLIHIGYKSDYTPDWAAFESFLNQKPAILFLPNPNQPIESCFSLDELRTIAQKCLEVGCLFVVDEAYHYFGADSALPLLKEFENVVVMRTFSKAFGIPSARLGYMVSTSENMDLLCKTRFAHEANSFSAAMAEYLLDHFEIVKNYTHQINQSRIYVKEALQKLGIPSRGEKGNYLLITLKSNEQTKKCVEFLRNQKIYVKGPWASPWDNCITITLAPQNLMERFIKSMETFVREQ